MSLQRSAKRMVQCWRANTHEGKSVIQALFPMTLSWIVPYDLEESRFNYYIRYGQLHVNETREDDDNWVSYRPCNEGMIPRHPGLDLKQPICHIDVDHATTIESVQPYVRCTDKNFEYENFRCSSQA